MPLDDCLTIRPVQTEETCSDVICVFCANPVSLITPRFSRHRNVVMQRNNYIHAFHTMWIESERRSNNSCAIITLMNSSHDDLDLWDAFRVAQNRYFARRSNQNREHAIATYSAWARHFCPEESESLIDAYAESMGEHYAV
jgi:hypothetical protein